jgi:hypothetical protein
MKEETKIQLQIYYGELMQMYESSHCYIEKKNIMRKKRAIEELLNLNIF